MESHKKRKLNQASLDGNENEKQKRIQELEETILSLQKKIQNAQSIKFSPDFDSKNEAYFDTFLNIQFHAFKQKEAERYSIQVVHN